MVNERKSLTSDTKVHLTNNKGKIFEGIIIETNKEADLTVIEPKLDLRLSTPFDKVDILPDVGTECIWGGFPRLVGEHSTHRIRFARGMVSSNVYSTKKGSYFDVDGIFNPGHSGSAVISIKTGELIGVVSRSAGELDEHFDNASNTIKAIQAIQSSWQLFEKTRQTMKEIYDYFRETIPEINGRFEEISRWLSSLGSSTFWGQLPNPAALWIRSEWENNIHGKIPNEVARILEEKGITVSRYPNNKTTDLTCLRAESDVAWRALIQLMLEWTELMKVAINESFQMGIGIASCGEPLRQLLP